MLLRPELVFCFFIVAVLWKGQARAAAGEPGLLGSTLRSRAGGMERGQVDENGGGVEGEWE